MTQVELRKKSVALRKAGYSYSLISEKLGVSKSTLSDWLSSIQYSPNRETIEKIGKARIASAKYKRNQKLQSIKIALARAKNDIGQLSTRDIFMIGIGLYIGEGSKTGHQIRIVNSEPKIIKFAIKWLKDIADLTDKNFTLCIHVYPDTNIKKILEFWSKYTGIGLDQFKKTIIDVRTNKKRSNHGKLPYGTAHLTVKSCGNKDFGVTLFRRLKAWMEIVLG